MTREFLARFPEFAEGLKEDDKRVISLTIEASKLELNQHLWGELFSEGVFYLAADKLMATPLGEDLRDPDEPSAKSLYALQFERLAKIVSMGARTI